jgi:hypothetical protein
VAVGGAENLVAIDLRGDDLSDDVAVGEANDQAVLGGVVLVLGLGDEALAGVVVGLTGTTTLVLNLVTAVDMSIAVHWWFKFCDAPMMGLTCSTHCS